jgi:glycosyltransferase involved in cell wall biosynthesis
MHSRIGFVSTRLAGTDGVSLEVAKWSNVLTSLGCECFYFAGESDRPADRSHVVAEAHFSHPAIQTLTSALLSTRVRSRETSEQIQTLKDYLKQRLYEFVDASGVELLIVENALSLPMNIPLGLALTEMIAETGIAAVAHHHDFFWERDRFARSAAEDYLRAAFPPVLPSIQHVTVNTFASRELALRTGASATVIPNVMDFDTPPPPADGYAGDLRGALGLSAQERLLLQPTRVVPRKRIERAIDLARLLDIKCALVISHTSGDEGMLYAEYLRDYATMLGVRVIFASDIVANQRGQTADGRKVYALADIYQQADLVTYPSRVEGFGNAFLETIYYRRPIVMGSYEIFRADIEPKGFQVITFHDFITSGTLEHARAVLRDAELVDEMVTINYELGRRYYSYRTLESNLAALLHRSTGRL